MKRTTNKVFLILGLIIVIASCITRPARRYSGCRHMPRYTESHGHYSHPFGDHYNQNKNYSR